jgi:hypothetical protein
LNLGSQIAQLFFYGWKLRLRSGWYRECLTIDRVSEPQPEGPRLIALLQHRERLFQGLTRLDQRLDKSAGIPRRLGFCRRDLSLNILDLVARKDAVTAGSTVSVVSLAVASDGFGSILLRR